MPKPSTVPAWNTGGVNRTAPSAGQMTDGYPPNSIPSSSLDNWLMFYLGEWAAWCNEGTSDPDETAHLVETDDEGAIQAAQVVIAGPSSLTSHGTASLVVESTIGEGIITEGAGSAVGISAIGGPTGSGVEGICGSSGSAGQAGVLGTGQGSRPGVLGAGGATGNGVEGTGGATSGTGVRGTGSAAGGIGVQGNGVGISPGVYGVGSTTSSLSAGVVGEADHADGVGVAGLADASGSTSGAAVRGNGRGAAAGVHGVGVNGYGVVAESDASSPTRAAMRIVPQDDTPSSPDDGALLYLDEGATTHQLMVRQESQWMGIHTTPGGISIGYGESLALSSTTAVEATPLTKVTCSFTEPPKRAGQVTIEACFECSNDIAGDAVGVELWDNTAGVRIGDAVEIVDHVGSTAGDVRFYVLRRRYTLPAAGARSIQLRVWRPSGSGTARIRDASVEIRGVY